VSWLRFALPLSSTPLDLLALYHPSLFVHPPPHRPIYTPISYLAYHHSDSVLVSLAFGFLHFVFTPLALPCFSFVSFVSRLDALSSACRYFPTFVYSLSNTTLLYCIAFFFRAWRLPFLERGCFDQIRYFTHASPFSADLHLIALSLSASRFLLEDMIIMTTIFFFFHSRPQNT